MTDITDLEVARVERDQPSLDDLINSFDSHNCDGNRPFIGQKHTDEGIRGEQIVNLRMRDIADCFVLALLTCNPDGKYHQVYVDEKGNKFDSLDKLSEIGNGYSDSHIDETKVSYNDVYGWDLDKVDPIAVKQNMTCFIERRMGIFPNITRATPTEEQ